MDSRPEVIAFAPAAPALEKTGLLQDIQNLRGARQFGYPLTDQEAISQGIGPREGITHGEHRAFVLPTTLYEQDKVSREIDGVQLEMVRLPGESEEEIMIWLPQKKVLCCGDNFYGCFPNLYAIRGGQYRDLAAWIHSIDVLMSYPAECLLPGHTAAILGHKTISSTLGNFRNAFEYILTQTLEGMNAGKTADQLAADIQLPPEYAGLPYLAEHYGCVEWTIRSIYSVPRRTFTKDDCVNRRRADCFGRGQNSPFPPRIPMVSGTMRFTFIQWEFSKRGSIAPKGFLAGKTGGVRNQRQRTALLYGMCQRNEPGINSNFFLICNQSGQAQ